MKRFICITVVLMLMLIFIGCATTTPEQRKEAYDLRKDVGNSQFVGSANNVDAVGMTKNIWW